MSDQTWRAVALGGVGLSLILILILALTYRTPRRVSKLVTAAYVIGIPIAVGLYLVLTRVALEPLWVVGSIALGVALGWWQGTAGHVVKREGRLYVQNAGWYLAAWGITCGVSQLVATLAGAMFPASIAAVSLIVGSGSLWASKTRLMVAARQATALRTRASDAH